MRIRTTAGVLVSGLALTLGASLGVSSTAVAAETDTPSAAAAKRALTDAKAALAGKRKTAGRADATEALRQLMISKDALSGADARRAQALLSRPSNGIAEFEGAPVWPEDAVQHGECGENVCVHWVEEGLHATTPEFAADVLEETDHVAQRYIEAGYRATYPDEGQGSNAIANTMPDIYIAEIGDDGLYGYCTSDAEEPVAGLAYYAFCVLDNDYAPDEFPTNTPTGNMQVTAAHEYFHAVQYAYDGWDDAWIYEATATWAEDEIYDDVNDNWNYFPCGQLGSPADCPIGGPGFSLDLNLFPYGNWIFFRYLSENFTESQGGMSTIVRDIWENLDTTSGGTDLYSLQAVTKALADRGTSMANVYSDFAVANNTPPTSYDEGADYPYPAYAFNPVNLTKNKNSATKKVALDHLTHGAGAFLPFAKGYQLKVSLDMANKKAGSRAAVAVYKMNGQIDVMWVKLNKKGNGSKTVPFGSDKVGGVEVTVINASTAMEGCGTDPEWQYSCGGFGKYDGQTAKISVKAVK